MIALRKGPEHIPGSWLLLALSAALLLFAGFVFTQVVGQSFGLSLVTNALGVGFYALVLVLLGYSRRLLQTLTTIVGCGAILTVLFAAELVLLQPLLGVDVANLIALLIVFWSVFVEGHIMSRAISRHLFAGVALAMAAFTLQYVFQLHAART